MVESTESIKKISQTFQAADVDLLPDLIKEYRDDERSGVVRLLTQAKRRVATHQAERERTSRMWHFERQYCHLGLVCGVDEVGRGPLAGPVVAGAVILPPDCPILYLNDSKKLSEKRREELYELIIGTATAYGLGFVAPERIDEINILQATYEAMREAIAALTPAPQVLLNDAVTIPGISIKQVPIIGGDGKSASIAAASIIAKVTRDRMMADYDRVFPGYGFAAHKGYGSTAHYAALQRLGPTPIHRRSFLGEKK